MLKKKYWKQKMKEKGGKEERKEEWEGKERRIALSALNECLL